MTITEYEAKLLEYVAEMNLLNVKSNLCELIKKYIEVNREFIKYKQKEIKKLNKQLKAKNELQAKIDKAIEYIENQKDLEEDSYYKFKELYQVGELLEILQDGE